jgi:hypothetical protein
LKNHAIGTLDLAIAPRAGDRGVVDVDRVVLAKSQKADPVKADPRSVIVTPAFLAPNKSPNKSCVFSKLSS